MSQNQHDRRIDYIEFPVADVAVARRFYSSVFGWEFTDYGPAYTPDRPQLKERVMPGIYLALLGVFAVLGAPADLHGQATGRQALNPPSLPPPRGYSHVVIAPAGRRAYISGQVAVDSLGAVVGAGDFRAQCVQVFENLGRALHSVGATFADVVSTNMYVTDLSHLAILREVRARYLPTEAPPASTLVQVVALYRPELMIEIAVEAVLPEARSTESHR